MTDIPQRPMAPAVVLQLGRLAREILRDIPPEELQDGVYMDLRDGNGNRWCSGVDLLMHALRRKFMPVEVETAIASMADL
eukprot:1444422-Pyramimonas_sp.AAC.1